MPNTVAFGPIFPGDEAVEHKPDEYIALDKLMKNAKIIAAAMYEMAEITPSHSLKEEHVSMKITEIRIGRISVPLRVPFKTALRSVDSVEDVVFEFHTDTGAVGYGEAPPTGVITGDTTGSIIGAMQDHIRKVLIGREVDAFENCTRALNGCIVKNTSAKAAADMALWDLYGQLHKIPVYKLLGGARKSIVTDITISVNDPEEMARDADRRCEARVRLPEG